ncbi:hypothetical protein [uncultured Flavobacterium sp.]|uniref:hypothetical protein n=1 Tax=uncultured Flavobacterium sp. TaxID=165435 RepID=UPI002598DE2F|nr:hypothetical protein [uncultured Flavobacterium sp.]
MLAAFSLLGGSLVSCDNETVDENGAITSYASDDGDIPIPPPPPPDPIIVKPKP